MSELDKLLLELSQIQKYREPVLSNIRQAKKSVVKWEDKLVELKEMELKLVEKINQEKHKSGLV